MKRMRKARGGEKKGKTNPKSIVRDSCPKDENDAQTRVTKS